MKQNNRTTYLVIAFILILLGIITALYQIKQPTIATVLDCYGCYQESKNEFSLSYSGRYELLSERKGTQTTNAAVAFYVFDTTYSTTQEDKMSYATYLFTVLPGDEIALMWDQNEDVLWAFNRNNKTEAIRFYISPNSTDGWEAYNFESTKITQDRVDEKTKEKVTIDVSEKWAPNATLPCPAKQLRDLAQTSVFTCPN